MRTPLIAALALVSVISLVDTASASTKEAPDFDRDSLKAGCKNSGGVFKEGPRSYSCTTLSGSVIDCLDTQICTITTPFPANKDKAGAATTAGGLGNAQFPGGTTGAGGTPAGGTAPARAPTGVGTLNGSPNRPVVRDHRPGGNASDAPPAGGTAPARTPTAVGTLNGSPNGPVRDHRTGGNNANAAPPAAAAGGTTASQKYRTLQ